MIQQNTPEWLEWRRKKIGASDISIIIGASPYCTPLTLWKRKLGFEEDPPMHPGMIYGHENESRVRSMVQSKLGFRLDPVVMQHPKFEWATCSLDGYNKEHGVVVEIKCCNKVDHDIARSGKIPDKYYPQLIWQLFVSDAEEAHYCSFHDEDLVTVMIESDLTFLEKIFGEAMSFYQCLVDYDAPPPSERDHVEIDDPDFGEAAFAWQGAKESLEKAKKQEAYYRNKLISFTDDGNCQGYGVRMTRVNQKGSIEWDKVCEAHKIDKSSLDEFRKEQIGFWKISLLKEV